jgi:hypothetical protein
MEQEEKQEVVEVHNVWTIYGMNPDGTEAENPIAEFSRPQDWGHPRWKYHRFRFDWLSAPDGKLYINRCHCWTDLQREEWEYLRMFGPLISTILQPGHPPELCGRTHLAEEDFWNEAWGEMPPVYEPDEDDYGLFLFTPTDVIDEQPPFARDENYQEEDHDRPPS